MANEVLVSGIGDLIAGEVMANEFLLLLADRDASILTHPSLFYATGLPNSNVIRVPHIGLGGYDLLSATTPGSEVANTALSDGSTDVTVAMYAKRYNTEDQAKYLIGGKMDAAALGQDAALSVAQTLISLIANVTDGFTATAGTSGVNAAWSDVVTAKTKLAIAKASGPMLAIVHPQQWGDLEADTLSLGAAPAQVLAGSLNAALGSQYKGQWLGIDFYVSSAVPTANAGADRAGGIFTRGAVAWADQAIPDEGDPNIVNLGRARFERVRQGNYVATSWITSYACGVAKAIDGSGVSLITDA